MKILRLALVNYKRMIKDIGALGSMFIMPLAVIMMTSFIAGNASKSLNINVAFDVADKGACAQAMMEELNITDNVFYGDREKAMELLEKNDVLAVYSIPEDFSEKISSGKKPTIEAFRREEGNATLPLEISMNDSINKMIKEQVLLSSGLIDNKDDLYNFPVKATVESKKKQMGSGLNIAVILIIYFIILSANSIGSEILMLRKQKVLSRAVTTSNRSYEITGSIILAMFLIQISVNLLVLFVSKLMLGFTIVNFHIIIINMVLASLISISLGFLITRIFENPASASFVLTLFCVATSFLGIFSLPGENTLNIPWALRNLAKFTPQYWLLDSIDRSVLFPNALALLLMALALFTAGNLKVKNYIGKP